MEMHTFLFSFSRVSLYFYSSFSQLLSCSFVFEHVSGSSLLSDWNRCCAWIVVVLFWCDCSSVCEYVQWLWWKWIFFPSALSSLRLGLKSQRCYPAHPVWLWWDPAPNWIVPCVGVDVPAWVITSWPDHSVLYGLEVTVSWIFDHWLIWDADVSFIRK